MSSILSKIISREIPADIVYEDDKYIAILDINPVRDGHVLVIPKKESDYLFELSDEEYLDLMKISKKIALIIESKLKDITGPNRISLVVEGLEVPHVHVHLIPLYNNEGLALGHKTNFTREEIINILCN